MRIFLILLTIFPFCLNASDSISVNIGSVVFEKRSASTNINYRHYFHKKHRGIFFESGYTNWLSSEEYNSGTFLNSGVGFRFGSTWFVEGSTSPGYLTNPDNKRLSGNLQFMSGVGTGYNFKTITSSLRYLHISNAGIKKPNDGMDIIYFGVEWIF